MRHKEIFQGVFWVLILTLGCAKNPNEKVASGEDHNLFLKAELTKITIDSAKLSGTVKNLLTGIDTKTMGDMSFEVSKSYLTLYKGGFDSIEKQATIQYKIENHWDLITEENKNGDKSQYLVQDKTQNPDWRDRAYIEVDPYAPLTITAKKETMVNLFSVSDLKSFYVIGKDAIPGVASRELDALKKQFSLADGDKVFVKLTKTEMIYYQLDKNGSPKVISKAPVSYFDIARDENEDGDLKPDLVRNQSKQEWSKRKYVEINPTQLSVGDNEKQYLNKVGLDGSCVEPSSVAELKEVFDANGISFANGEKVCFEASQSVLSVFSQDSSGNKLLLTMDIIEHVDINFNGQGVDDVLGNGSHQKRWDQRQYVLVSTANTHKTENLLKPNVLSKSNFKGEYIYVATVLSANSENGAFFEGQTLVGSDRLQFEVSQNYLTGYRVSDTLNQSDAKSPSLRYNIELFDVERARNGLGDYTHVVQESARKPWDQRENVRVEFTQNLAASYLNDLMGLQKLMGYESIISGSQLIEPVEVDNGYVSWVSEDVFTPSIATSVGEQLPEPMSVTVRHALVRVDNRTYLAQAYPDSKFNRFGYFRTTQFGLDGELRATDQTLQHYIGRHDVSGDKKIEFYLDPNYPEKYKAVTKDVLASWNEVLKTATGKEEVVVLKENSGQKVGDPRYNMIVMSTSRNLRAPAGYGPSIPDPLTGEFVSSRSYIYEEAIHSIKRMAGDYYDLIKGGKTPADFANDDGTSDVGSTILVEAITGSDDAFDTNLDLGTIPASLSWNVLADASRGHLIDTATKISGISDRVNPNMAAMLQTDVSKEFQQSANFKNSLAEFEKLQGYLASRGQCLYETQEHVVSAVEFIRANISLDRNHLLDLLVDRSIYNILLHEVGHNLGLRHNFQGSYDLMNFHSEYFDLKARERAGEVSQGDYAANYRTSSVMDYTDLFEALAKKPGKYDVAAIKFGYGDVVEVMKRSTDGEVVRDQFGIPVSEDKALSAVTGQDLLMPYKFCTDGHVASDPTCNRFDRGTTVTEIVKSLTEQYDVTYFLRGFRRGRRSFSGSSSRVLMNTLLPVRQTLDELFYKLIQGEFEGQDPNGTIQPGNFADYYSALNEGLGFYTKVLSAVEPGRYHLDAATGKFVTGASTDETAQNLIVPLGIGKYLESSFLPGGEWEGSERIMRRGVEFDKLATLFAMSMRGYPARKYQRASLSVNYFAVAKEMTLDIFSKFMRDDYQTELKAVKTVGSSNYVAVSDAYQASEGEEVVTIPMTASTSLTVKSYAMLFAMLNYNSSADKTFKDYIDFRIKGVDDSSIPTGAKYVEFTAGSGLRTYVVPQSADGLSISYKIAEPAAEASSKKQGATDKVAELDEAMAEKITAAFEPVMSALKIVYKAANGDDLPAATEESIRNGDKGSAITTMTSFIDRVEVFATQQQMEELITLVKEQKATYVSLVAGLSEMLAQKQQLTTEIEGYDSSLKSIESALIQLKELYEVFN